MKWIVAAPFVVDEDPKWIFEFIDRRAHDVSAVPATYDHDRSRKKSSVVQWIDYFAHGFKSFLRTQQPATPAQAQAPIGIITVFPQLALIVALFKKLTGRRLPLIAWCFNLAQPYGGLKRRAARFCFSSIDLFVVHSRAEIGIYSKWLDLPQDRFVFVPLSAVVPFEETWADPEQDPYVIALGTANRDYALLAEAVGRLGYKTIIVSGRHATDHIVPPPCVTFRSDLSPEQCHQLAVNSRLSVIPIQDHASPSGQVTFIQSMMTGVPLIATRCAGTRDYLEDGVDSVLVEPGDVVSLEAALKSLWTDAEKRTRLAARASQAAFEKYTFRAVSGSVLKLMNQLEKHYLHG